MKFEHVEKKNYGQSSWEHDYCNLLHPVSKGDPICLTGTPNNHPPPLKEVYGKSVILTRPILTTPQLHIRSLQ